MNTDGSRSGNEHEERFTRDESMVTLFNDPRLPVSVSCYLHGNVKIIVRGPWNSVMLRELQWRGRLGSKI